MKQKKRGLDKRGQMICGIVCLSFLLGVTGGALAANGMNGEQQTELMTVLQEGVSGGEATFWGIFWKYLKYDMIIWAGGWMSLGLIFSGAAFLLRSVCLGFTAAMMMTTYGIGGFFAAAASILPQNIFLIPVYIFMMSASAYYLFSWQESGRLRARKRDRRQKQTEYCILFGVSLVFLLVASGIERLVLLG